MLILGLGSLLRADDGVGAAVIQALSEDGRLPADVTLLDGGTPGLETALLLQGYQQAIIVDAADMGLSPGAWQRFALPEVELQSNSGGLRGNLHQAGVAEALQLGKALGILPDEIIIYGIQPQTLDWAEGLSEIVKSSIPAVCASIIHDVERANKSNGKNTDY